jgi:hypothetical protein
MVNGGGMASIELEELINSGRSDQFKESFACHSKPPRNGEWRGNGKY